jgi:hypothetical protein
MAVMCAPDDAASRLPPLLRTGAARHLVGAPEGAMAMMCGLLTPHRGCRRSYVPKASGIL